MSPARLIDVATQLTLTSADTPECQERFRRAVSTAHYAIFHTLTGNLCLGAKALAQQKVSHFLAGPSSRKD